MARVFSVQSVVTSPYGVREGYLYYLLREREFCMEQISKQEPIHRTGSCPGCASNDSVLDEAVDERVPLLERLKFVSIFTSNLDEFFMIRVGSLHDQEALGSTAVDKKSGMTPASSSPPSMPPSVPSTPSGSGFSGTLTASCAPTASTSCPTGELENSERAFLQEYYESNVAPILSLRSSTPSPLPPPAKQGGPRGGLAAAGGRRRSSR